MRRLALLSILLAWLAAPASAHTSAGGGGVKIPSANAELPTADVTTWSLSPTASAAAAAADAASSDPVAHGRYLAAAGDCVSCHTNPGGAPYAGARPIRTPFGIIYSANLTPDLQTGIRAVSADQFYQALYSGVGHRGENLYPAFPYTYFTHISRRDSDDLRAYLMSLPAVHQAKPANRLPFPLNLRFLMRFWKAMAATLHAHGITDIATSSQAAEALRPIAGEFAFALFALGIIGTGMLAVPILAGSAADAVAEMVGVPGSLDAKPLHARLFYATIAVTTLLGSCMNYVHIDPARTLYWAAVVNGVLAAPLMGVMMLILRNPLAMGRLTLSRRATILGWTATTVMAAASIVSSSPWPRCGPARRRGPRLPGRPPTLQALAS